MITRDRLLSAVRVIGERAADSEGDIVDALVAAGFSWRESELLSAFLPMAFARVALETIGRIDFIETVSAKTRRGAWVQIPLRDVPMYGAALALARESYRTGAGILPQEQFSAVAGRSAEVHIVSKALYAGASIDGAVSATALIRLSAEDLGYGSLWSRLWARLFG